MEELALTDTESRYYSDLFLCCDVEKTGKAPTLKATEFFRSANLSNDIIRQIMTFSGVPQNALHISRQQFYSCLKLIAASQASITLRSELISASLNLPLPRFSWKDSPPQHGRHNLTNVNNVSSGSSNVEANGLINNSASTSSSTGHLSEIRQWPEVRSPDLIELSRPTDTQQDTGNSDLQSTDSEVERNESSSGRRRHRSGSPEAWSTNSDSPTPTNSVAERPWAKDTLWQGLLGDEHRQLLGTEEESSDRHSSDDDNETDLESVYQITPEQREYYHKQFKAVQPDPKGLLSGHIARVFFEKSRIPVEELRHIWQLCDVTRDGALSLAEFTAAMHLVVLRRNNIPLPATLPPCLHTVIVSQSIHLNDPPEADLLHLGDDDKSDDAASSNVFDESNYKRITNLQSDKNSMNPNTLTSSGSNTLKRHDKSSTSPTGTAHNKTRSISNSPPSEPAPVATSKSKESSKDWTNQNKEWTKFTESPTSNVSSPGLKPVNFDMQRTAQAVVSDPQILHPVPLRVTPVVGAETVDDESGRNSRKLENLVFDGPVILRENQSSPKQYAQQHQQQHRESLQNNDLRAIQRPQPKKIPTKSAGAIPPPPQREPSVGNTAGDPPEIHSVVVGQNLSSAKRDGPPVPPPRPHRHARSSSLDLNKLKMTGNPSQPEITTQNSLDVQIDSNNAGFADFTHFPEGNMTVNDTKNQNYPQNDLSLTNSVNHPRPTIGSLQTNQRVSAFEVYKKPNTPRNSQSPESTLQPPSSSYQNQGLPSTNSSSTVSIQSGLEYERRVAAISESLRHITFKQDRSFTDVLRHLREQNVLLLRLCNDLSEELLTVQQRKEDIRSKLESATNTTGNTSGNISVNLSGGTGNNAVHSNV